MINRIALIAPLWSLAAFAAEPRLYGDDTELRGVFQRATDHWTSDGALWGHKDTVVALVVFPRAHGHGPKAADLPPGYAPWRPVAVAPRLLPADKASRKALARGRVIIVVQEESKSTCIINDLSGRRILAEAEGVQDASSRELACGEVGAVLASLGVPDGFRQEIQDLLASKPRDGGK